MKKIINIVSWVSYFTCGIIIALWSIYVGSQVACWFRDLIGIPQSSWWLILLVPILFIVTMAVFIFILLGAKKFSALDF